MITEREWERERERERQTETETQREKERKSHKLILPEINYWQQRNIKHVNNPCKNYISTTSSITFLHLPLAGESEGREGQGEEAGEREKGREWEHTPSHGMREGNRKGEGRGGGRDSDGERERERERERRTLEETDCSFLSLPLSKHCWWFLLYFYMDNKSSTSQCNILVFHKSNYVNIITHFALFW